MQKPTPGQVQNSLKSYPGARNCFALHDFASSTSHLTSHQNELTRGKKQEASWIATSIVLPGELCYMDFLIFYAWGYPGLRKLPRVSDRDNFLSRGKFSLYLPRLNM